MAEVDDGSADRTSDIARAHGVDPIRHPVNRGLSSARNSGVRRASASVVAFLDHYCEPKPDWAERLRVGYDDKLVPEASNSTGKGVG
jgi:glycosyltransferase involved in cell wall biosynthesis